MNIDLDEALSGGSDWITPDIAEKLAKAPLKCITQEFPHYIHSIPSMESIQSPKEKHPVFYGCFDWHSSVHSYWSLIRQLRITKEHPLKEDIVETIDEHFTEEKVMKEVGFFEENPKFEKPYGWGWFLKLFAELELWDSEFSERWSDILKPLEVKVVELVRKEFLTQQRPHRVGTHGNSAFSLTNLLDHAGTTSNERLESEIIKKSKDFYLDDEGAPVDYEPIGWDFLSPSLCEADLMRRVLTQEEFVHWLDKFLPKFDKTTIQPIDVELDELMKYHLVGLNLSRAWCFKGISNSLPKDHRYRTPFKQLARTHAKKGLEQAFTEDYGGAHWLLSYVLYLFTNE